VSAAEQETPDERRKRYSHNGMTLAWWAEQRPDDPAIVAPSGSRTFAELNANANRLVRALRRRGLGDGDAIALACGNRAEFAETVYAASRAGFRITTVNWHLTGEEAGYIIGNCEAKALIADAAVAEMAAGAMAEAPGCRVRLASTTPRWRSRTGPTSTTRRRAARCSTRPARPASRRACTVR
jgi:long-chain acyl-CoA synthetase